MKKLLLLPLSILLSVCAIAQLSVQKLLTENKPNPMGVDALQPRFTWLIDAGNRRNVSQSAYEIAVQTADGQTIWNSGKQSSDQSVLVAYKGPALQSGQAYGWRVRVWDNTGKASAWSAPATWHMGLLQPSDWKAQWIEPGFIEEDTRPSPLMRKEFTLGKKINKAIAYITAHGLYEAFINGSRVGADYLTPGWTSYNKRLQYQVYDVTNQLQQGVNAIGVALASGWYRGNLAWGGNRDIYGKDIALLLQISIEYSDGTTEQVVTDNTWKSSTGAIRSSEIYHGEKIDARLEQEGWNKPRFNDAQWSGVKTANHSKDLLVATYNEPVRKRETFDPVKIFTTPKGEKVIDFGQNLVGWTIMKVAGTSGLQIILSHAEVLDKQGNFYTDNLRAANSRDTFILKGGTEILEPHFAWHGFRYLKVEGYPGELKPENFKAVALYSDMPVAGKFTSSNVLVNQLQHNIAWGQRGNFLDVPTDCPQRDERLGWTGDAQVFGRTAMFNMNVHNFFAKWLRDVEADQQLDGAVPFVVPNVLGPTSVASAGWADAATILPWNLYLAYGDTGILQTQYSSMKAWVEYMRSKSRKNLWNTGFHFGDWLFYRPDDDNDGRAAVTDKYLIAQCFYAHSTQLLINVAKVLGKTSDVQEYTTLLQNIKDAFRKEYMTSKGRLVSGTQTAYVLALHFDMLPEELRPQAAERLAENIRSYGNHLTTGFLGTPYLCEVLSKNGHTDLAYTLLLREKYPSWLFPVKMGATTIWERWDGQKPDSSFQTPGMNSFNHYAYGAIGDWMYRTMVGLDTYEDGPGYKHIRVKPLPGGGFSYASATLETYYGTVHAGWLNEGGTFQLDVDVPANTRATIFIPAASADVVKEGQTNIENSKDLKVTGIADGYVQIETGSGKYHFSAPIVVATSTTKR